MDSILKKTRTLLSFHFIQDKLNIAYHGRGSNIFDAYLQIG